MLLITLFHVLILVSLHLPSSAAALLARQSSDLFRSYIGAEFEDVKFSDVPINPSVEFHFILSFAIDYNADDSSSTHEDLGFVWHGGGGHERRGHEPRFVNGVVVNHLL
ncbi:hypothetical protein KSP40_PGU005389 [Platanthera guangdongensis]|uniref:Uncharacterized protein n=1 Tax=Platanthera guangdongensis TaxID=2320717 RepID=A0ABR2N5N2_9ASPA